MEDARGSPPLSSFLLETYRWRACRLKVARRNDEAQRLLAFLPSTSGCRHSRRERSVSLGHREEWRRGGGGGARRGRPPLVRTRSFLRFRRARGGREAMKDARAVEARLRICVF